MSTIISAPLVFGQESVPEEETRRVLGCSFPMDRHFSVTALGQSSQLRLYYFVGAGFIPYTVEEDGYKVPETVVLINLKQDRAVVQYLWHDGNALTFSQSPFLLRRHSWGWQVSKGPLGPGTQDTVADFVSSLLTKKQLRLVPASSMKRVEGVACVDAPFSY
jgi:hypothetical protein